MVRFQAPLGQGTLLNDAMLVELDPPSVQRGSLRIEGRKIVERGTELTPQRDDDVIGMRGKWIFPGLVSAHHHFTSLYSRGAPHKEVGAGLERTLSQNLSRAVDVNALRAAAVAAAIEGLQCGTTTIFEFGAAHLPVPETLNAISQGISATGMRAVLGRPLNGETTPEASAVLESLVAASKALPEQFRLALSLDSVHGLSDAILGLLKEVQSSNPFFVHVHLGDDVADERRSLTSHGKSSMQRLLDVGLIDERAVIAPAVHLSWPELSSAMDQGAWMVHCARSSMALQSGVAAALKFGMRGGLGTDTQSLDVLSEAKAAWLKSCDAGQPIDVIRFLCNGHRLASRVYGENIGALQPGAAADLVVFGYEPHSPVTVETLAHHLVFGFDSRHVESVMLGGIWRLWGRTPLSTTLEEVGQQVREANQAVWSRISSSS